MRVITEIIKAKNDSFEAKRLTPIFLNNVF